MTKKIVWRLGKLPSPDEVRGLVADKIITQEEAREVLFNSEDEIDRDKKSLESEIKFLRELIEKLSQGRNQIIETIKVVEKPYYRWDWYKPYEIWCSSGTTTCSSSINGTFADTSGANFSNISTF